MTSNVVRLIVALAVVVALVGAIGLVSAEMNTTPDEPESNSMGDMAGHMSGDMNNHMGEDMLEIMQNHMADHDPGDHHDGEADHC